MRQKDTQAHRRKLSVAGHWRGQKTRDRILALLDKSPFERQMTDEEIAKSLGFKSRVTIAEQLQKLRLSGIITSETTRAHFGGSWKNTRTIKITEVGQNAVSESKIRLQGNSSTGPSS